MFRSKHYFSGVGKLKIKTGLTYWMKIINVINSVKIRFKIHSYQRETMYLKKI